MSPEAYLLLALVALALAALGFAAGVRIGRRRPAGRETPAGAPGDGSESVAAPSPAAPAPAPLPAAPPSTAAAAPEAVAPRSGGGRPEPPAARRPLSLEDRLRRAVDHGELELVYEPILELASHRLVAFEASLRWRIRPGHVLSIDRFGPLAEQTGLAAELDDWALVAAAAQLRAWHEAGFPNLSVSLNLSAPSFDDPDLARRAARVVAEHGLPPQAVELEVGERVAMRDPGAAGDAFAALERRGLRLAIDDFGSAYSSLLYLRSFPIHTLKIDRSFVRGIVTEPADQEIAASLIRLAHALGVTVVGEGVESDEQISALRRHGCDRAQGHRVSPPAAAPVATRLLEAGVRLPARDSNR